MPEKEFWEGDKMVLEINKLSTEEQGLFKQLWYHDFSKLGCSTEQYKTDAHRINQGCKEKYICEYIDIISSEEINTCVELFCADSYYSQYAISKGIKKSYAVDLNQYEIDKAKLITKIMGNKENIKIEKKNVFDVEGSYDLTICCGGLYHLSNPIELLQKIYTQTNKYMIVQTVYDKDTEDENHFKTPAPHWTWGCRFSYKYLINNIKKIGFEIIKENKNTLNGNQHKLDIGSMYILCKKGN